MGGPVEGGPIEHTSDAVLVTGGAGFVGKNLVKALSSTGRTVVSIYRNKLPEPMANVYPVCSDLSSSDLLAAPLRGIDTVVHLAWTSNFVGPVGEISWNITAEKPSENIQVLKNLINAMERSQSRRIVFISALGAERRALSPYLKEKYLAESLILNSKIPEKVILRCGVICGGGNDRFLKSIVNLMKFPGIYPVPRLKETIAPLHIDDLVEVLVKAIDHDINLPCAVLEIVGDEKYKIEELFKLVSDRYVKGTKLQIRGALGESILPFFEKGSDTDIKLKHYLSLGMATDPFLELENPLSEILPKKKRSFRKVLATNQAM